jgi:hypothetical protein
VAAAGAGLLVLVAGYVSVLPGFTDSTVMALMHLPILVWAYVGVAFMGASWRETDPRIRFVRFSGELVVLVGVVALGGLVLSGVTAALLGLIDESMAEWYAENIGLMGAAAIPVVAAYLYEEVLRRRVSIAPILARVFAPLFFVMIVTYLIVAATAGKNPFLDRSSLVALDGLLLVVAGISVFSLVGRDREAPVGLTDYVSLALIGATLLIDTIALAAIVFRLASYGLTPNRVAVLGANMVILVHLVLMGRAHVEWIRGRAAQQSLERVVARYLPVYCAWAATVAFVLPLAFGYR